MNENNLPIIEFPEKRLTGDVINWVDDTIPMWRVVRISMGRRLNKGVGAPGEQELEVFKKKSIKKPLLAFCKNKQ